MDPQSFDSLVRSLAAPKSRRGLLGTLAALGAGLLGAHATDAQQVTQAQCGNVICGSNPGVCNPGCVCCTYSNGNSRCLPPTKCTAPGTVATTTTTAAPLLGLGAVCTTTDQCDQAGGQTTCKAAMCDIEGPPICCRVQGAPCTADCDCCEETSVCISLGGGPVVCH